MKPDYRKPVVQAKLCMLFIISAISTLYAQNSVEQIQKIHQKINADLMTIRKKFPKSQRTVYSLLDQVCKIYKVSKEKMAMETNLKLMLQEKMQHYNTLKEENNTLKAQIETLQGELSATKTNLTSAAQKLEEKKSMISFMKKEKTKLETERNKLNEEKEKLIKASQLQQKLEGNEVAENKTEPDPANLSTKAYTSMLKQRRHTLKMDQSLNLTSTSEPISPL